MSTAPLLFELGCEEIPAGVAPLAGQSLHDQVVAALDAAGIAHGASRWLGTPRRLTVHVEGVALQQPDREELLTGPPLRAAKDASGQWTKAAEGFARGQGVALADLAIEDTPKGAYVVAHKRLQGRATAAVVADLLPDVLRNLPFPKRMRWGREREPFVRPLHWLVALLGDAGLDFTFAGVRSGRSARGHRFFADREVELAADLDVYLERLRGVRVEPDPAVRRATILQGISTLASEAGGAWVEDAQTLDTVTWLVEWPLPLLGAFDPAYLQIPAPVIRTTLRENQKLFTLTGPDGRLLPRFVAVANTLTEQSRATVAQGNARVVSARLSDAQFFHAEDTRVRLETRRPALDARIWLAGLGSVGDKVRRVEALAETLAGRLCPEEALRVARAAFLCKCDLATRMVFEFPELQGHVGADYARIDGEDPVVAQAIAEHYLPRFAGDALPTHAIGAVLSLADKADTVAGCFALGLQPTGTQDPYALRRQALGILRILGEAEASRSLPLTVLVRAAVQTLAVADMAGKAPDEAALEADLLRFFRARLASMYQAEFPADLVDAVLDAGFDRVGTVAPRLRALDVLRKGDGFAPLAAAFKRVANIVRKSGDEVAPGAAVDPARFQVAAEATLDAAVRQVQDRVNRAISQGLYDDALAQLVAVKPAVDGFFDDVMVMTDDAALRHNRLALLRSCAALFAQVADFARIQA